VVDAVLTRQATTNQQKQPASDSVYRLHNVCDSQSSFFTSLSIFDVSLSPDNGSLKTTVSEKLPDAPYGFAQFRKRIDVALPFHQHVVRSASHNQIPPCRRPIGADAGDDPIDFLLGIRPHLRECVDSLDRIPLQVRR